MNPSVAKEIFSINFIRHEFMPTRVRRIVVYAALGYLAVSVAIGMGLLGGAIFSWVEWHWLEARLRGKMVDATALTLLNRDMETIEALAVKDLNQLNAIVSLKKQHFPIAGKLAALTETLPARTWINRISGNPDKRTLEIESTYIISPDKPYELPVKGWIEALKSDPRFGQRLKQLDLGSSSRKQGGKGEVFSFELLAAWEPLAK